MRTRNFFRLVCLAVVVMGLLFVPATPNQATNVAAGQTGLALQAPPFVNVARAAGASPTTFDLGAYLDQEAGISAYYHSPDAITLSQVRGQFRTIEMETPDFIIGSVAVPNYAECSQPHFYVGKNGWILGYYFRGDFTSKMIDVKAKTINTTKLKTVVGLVASAAGAPFTDVNYYDFRYPNATNILLVAKTENTGNNFTIQLPSAFGYFDRGWALTMDLSGPGYGTFSIDGVNHIGSAITCLNDANYGTLTVSDLLQDTAHTIVIHNFANAAYGVLTITYWVP